ncbi:MAG TPA: SH3 domain-containing protein [Frateuria sp.]|uniref:SH3 domain-containing protein n=1 Tax=Frateuria sp. TaxID=2211372 RepID=UPI002D811285|nr:SH3 domain-containing protein [Frateuria sp.]HET6804979.1 SH3 domain-containing protein [Frateuria sp.]
MKRSAWYGALALLAGIPLQAMAADGYVTGTVTLRAGPDIGYPAVDMIPAGAPVGIEGCTDGWEWCDVVFEDERGWVAGTFIQQEYDDRPVLVHAYGARLGVPIVSFSIVTYWDRHYVGRPFYRERERWYRRPPPHHAPPPPHGPWAHPQRLKDHRGDHDRDRWHAAPAPYRRPEPTPGRVPPRVPADRQQPKAPPTMHKQVQRWQQRPPAPNPTRPPQGAPIAHPPAVHAPADHRTDARRPPPHDHDQHDRGH